MFYTGTVKNAKTGLPMAGVSVSDGKNIVKTAEDGSYQLSGWERSNVIHVGLLTEKHDDWFKYTANKSGVYNFEVTPANTDASKFCFFQTSDTEIANRSEHPWTDYYAQKAKEHNPAFIIHTGDIHAKDGLCRHYSVMSNQKMGCPVRYAIGNHDYCAGAYGEQLFEMIYGPTWCSFDCGDIHFVILSIGHGDNPSGYKPQDMFDWLCLDLDMMDESKKLIVFDHDCCFDEYSLTHKLKDAKMEFGDKRLIAWVYGHYHHNCDILQNGVHLICTATPDFGGIDSSPAGLRKININGGQVSSEMMYYGHATEECSDYVWRTKLDGRLGFCSHLLYGDNIIAATMDEGSPKKCGIYMLCCKTGEVKWRFETENAIKNDFATDGGRLYAQDCAGTLYCIDTESGKLIWKVRSKLFRALKTNMSVCVADGLVIAGNQNQLYAYDKESGKQVWYRGTLKGGGTPARFVKDNVNKTVIVSPQWAKITAIEPKTGIVRWENGERGGMVKNKHAAFGGRCIIHSRRV